MNFVGLKNYVRGLNDRHFHSALRITFFFTVPERCSATRWDCSLPCW